MAQRLSMIDEAAQVSVFGSRKYAVCISVDPNKLAANSLSIDMLPQAIIKACHVRFCPIMMTIIAAFAGASSRWPAGLAVVGGLLVSQVLTLYLTPVIYLYMDRLQRRFQRAGTPKMAQTSAMFRVGRLGWTHH